MRSLHVLLTGFAVDSGTMRHDRVNNWWHTGTPQGVFVAMVAGALFTVAYLVNFQGIPHHALTIPAAALVGFFVGKGLAVAVMGGSGRMAQAVYMPSAAGSYANTHSHIDAMEAKGEYRQAVVAWEQVAAVQPLDPWPLIRAGELYMRILREPEQALDRFRQARGLPGIGPELHRYASQQVIDLYLGPLGDRGRAMVELRRLIDQHPGTREAEGARKALAQIKSERGEVD